MDRIEVERKAYELAKRYDKYSHETKNGVLYLIDVFLKEGMMVNEFDVPIVAFFCHDGKMLIENENQEYYTPEYFSLETLERFVSYISNEKNIFNDYPNGFYNDRKLIVK